MEPHALSAIDLAGLQCDVFTMQLLLGADANLFLLSTKSVRLVGGLFSCAGIVIGSGGPRNLPIAPVLTSIANSLEFGPRLTQEDLKAIFGIRKLDWKRHRAR